MSAAVSASAARSIRRTCWSAPRRSRFKRPVKWIEDRREHLIAANHSRQQQHRIRAAIDADGRILAIDDEILPRQRRLCAHPRRDRAGPCRRACCRGPYRVPAYRAVGHIRLTNKTPCGTYRAPGRYETTFVRERADRRRSRQGRRRPRRGTPPQSDRPERDAVRAPRLEALGTQVVYDSGDYAQLLDKALSALAGWNEIASELGEGAPCGKGELVGVGLAMFVEKSGLGPSDDVRIEVNAERRGRDRHRRRLHQPRRREPRWRRLPPTRSASITPRINVVHGQTDRIDRRRGRICLARHGDVRRGHATRAPLKLRGKALEARGRTDADRRRARSTSSMARSCATAVCGPSMTLAAAGGRREPGRAQRRGARSYRSTLTWSIPVRRLPVAAGEGRCRHRRVAIERYVIGLRRQQGVRQSAAGRIARSPAVWRKGLGGALREEFVYDDNGEPLSVTFADYLMPTARETPPVSIFVTEDAPVARSIRWG